MELYHGSNQFVNNPHIIDNPRNDFGYGLYLCDTFDKAAEWACGRHGLKGVVTTYEFDGFDGFEVLDFLDGDHNVFDWIATMLYYRYLDLDGDDLQNAADFLIDKFAIDTSTYDIVRGYRADDGYFEIVSGFLTGQFDIDGLKYAMSRGFLGEQITMKSNRAHNALYNPEETTFAGEDFHQYFSADGNRMKHASAQVRQINSHRGYHFYDLVNAYEDIAVAQSQEEIEYLKSVIDEIIAEGHIERR